MIEINIIFDLIKNFDEINFKFNNITNEIFNILCSNFEIDITETTVSNDEFFLNEDNKNLKNAILHYFDEKINEDYNIKKIILSMINNNYFEILNLKFTNVSNDQNYHCFEMFKCIKNNKKYSHEFLIELSKLINFKEKISNFNKLSKNF